MTREHTQHGPARYWADYDAESIQKLERETIREHTSTRGSPARGKTEYLRDTGTVIGWDQGEDAAFSFVECSGGQSSARTFHGRPMNPSNHKAYAMQEGER